MFLHLSRVCGAAWGHAGPPHLVCLTFTALERLRKQPAVISVNFLIRQLFALHVLSDTSRLLPHLPRASVRFHEPYLYAHGFLCSNRKSDQSTNSR